MKLFQYKKLWLKFCGKPAQVRLKTQIFTVMKKENPVVGLIEYENLQDKFFLRNSFSLWESDDTFRIKKYSNLCRWYEMLSERPAVIKGYKFMDKASDIPKP